PYPSDGSAPPSRAVRERRVARIVAYAFQPDHPTSDGAQVQGPVQVHPEVPASLGVADGVRRGETHREAHATPSESGGRSVSNQASMSTSPLRPHSAPSFNRAMAGQMTQLTPRAVSAVWNRRLSSSSGANRYPARSTASR